MIEFDQKEIDKIQYDTILTFKSKSLLNGRWNLLESNFELSTIRFGDPICLCLVLGKKNLSFHLPRKIRVEDKPVY